jgi:ferredoxin--NADP+ reductase/benzoate/toluate 1,2-dioxygenase reductase subunit
VNAAVERTALHGVLEVRELSESAYLLRLARGTLEFRPGQWINVGLPGSLECREYTVYSPPCADCLEVLIKEIPEGTVSPLLRRSHPGDLVEVEGPHGEFQIRDEDRRDGHFLFIATGTGISPFHCFVESHPGLDYLMLHGARAAGELYEHAAFDASRVVSCLSRGGGKYRGRVTDWLIEHESAPENFYYVCGNSDMIYDAFAILRARGVPRSRVFAEIYF